MTEDQKEKLEQLVNRTFYLLPTDEPDICVVTITAVTPPSPNDYFNYAELTLARFDGGKPCKFPLALDRIELLDDDRKYVEGYCNFLSRSFIPLSRLLPQQREGVAWIEVEARKDDKYLLSAETFEVICPIEINEIHPISRPTEGDKIEFVIPNHPEEEWAEVYNKFPFLTDEDAHGSFFIPYGEVHQFVRGETAYPATVEGKKYLVSMDEHFVAHSIEQRINDLKTFVTNIMQPQIDNYKQQQTALKEIIQRHLVGRKLYYYRKCCRIYRMRFDGRYYTLYLSAYDDPTDYDEISLNISDIFTLLDEGTYEDRAGMVYTLQPQREETITDD